MAHSDEIALEGCGLDVMKPYGVRESERCIAKCDKERDNTHPVAQSPRNKFSI